MQILRIIRDLIERNRYAPSIKEIGDRIPLTISPTRLELIRLEQQGFISRKVCTASALTILRWPDELMAA